MEVIVAEHAGFCFGVTKAVETVYDQIGQKKNIYTYGPIIHNETVVEQLRREGVECADPAEEIPEGALVVIRSHGVGKKTYERLERQGLICEDVTCPFVKKIHKIVIINND